MIDNGWVIHISQSVLWSEHFFGNGDGVVTNGPFADWNTAVGPLIRNLAHFGELFSKSNIAKIMSRSYTVEITEPLGLPEHNLEVANGPFVTTPSPLPKKCSLHNTD
jgi:hypothetical protein